MSADSLSNAFLSVVRRDLLLAYRHRAELINPLAFFVMVVTMFPLAVGADVELLRRIAPGVIWVAALLASLLSMDAIFRSDFEDGSLELMVMTPHPLSVLVLAKVTAHWLLSGLPLLLVSPLLAVMFDIESDVISVLLITLLLGTPVLSLIGAIAVALTVGLRKGGVLLAILVLPLYVPVLIFASGAVDAAASGLPVSGQLYMMSAMLFLAITLTPWPTAAALKMSLS
ncbi:MAG: heme exporter protein CcmB [Methylococcaceae bacterium]|jgi:heme exporter protein B|nr:heme exporter protein CcmB [Methylococcaceae bacterium]MDZ4157167.1 heme exporter protein CcmB [Methylococcales bacterium]MDP2394873.1 heme exporter protein CcmB [Methylococcaceae bacterium]MDP3020294.1 heme exporter protein CcmB [Methylococcaceae bacterium]MDP3390835.1 heme exporter protein CcmB [Methylococcaceae bacterium]